jgi:hypothetical protein
LSGIRVSGRADRGLLGVIEFPAAGGREKIHAGTRKGDTEIHRVADIAAARNAFISQKPAADGKLLADATPNLGEDFERRNDAIV